MRALDNKNRLTPDVNYVHLTFSDVSSSLKELEVQNIPLLLHHLQLEGGHTHTNTAVRAADVSAAVLTVCLLVVVRRSEMSGVKFLNT